MNKGVCLNAIVLFAIFGFASNATAQAGRGNGPPVVGMPGCASDVPVTASRERITLPSGGKDVSALLYSPRGNSGQGAALVIMHGRAIENDLVALDSHALQLASRGFAVILPFYLDAEREQTEPSKARAAHRIWRRVALDAADAIAAEVGIATGDVILWGHVRGGGIALAATLQPESPVGGAVTVNVGGSPQDDAQGAGRPFLLFHSAPSRLIPPIEVRTMADRIQQRGGQVQRIEIDAEAGQFTVSHWCVVMDGTRRLLEQTQAPRSAAAAGN